MKRFFSLALFLAIMASVASAAPSEIVISSFIKIGDDLGEVRGRVNLNGDKGAFVTVTNGGAAHSTLTDEKGAWSLLIALRSYKVEAYARSLDGTPATKGTEAEASLGKGPVFGPAPAELYQLCKGILGNQVAISPAVVTKLAQLMDKSIMHQGGWEFDNRMVLLLLGCIDRVVAKMQTAPAAERQALLDQLAPLGQLIYKGVVRGMDGEQKK